VKRPRFFRTLAGFSERFPMLKSVVHSFLRSLGVRAVRAHTLDGVEARIRVLEVRNAALAEQTEAQQRQIQQHLSRADQREAKLAELTARLADQTARLTREQDARAAALELLAQTRAVVARVATPPDPAAAADTVCDAGHWTRLGVAEDAAGRTDVAIAHYARAMQLIHRYHPAASRLAALAPQFLRAADAHAAAGRPAEAKRALVRAVELDPADPTARARLAAALDDGRHFDLTKICYVYHDPARGKAIYQEAFLRAAEYVAGGGVVGEFFEFGVLGGFTARLQCELIRDLRMWREVHLFDSFEGLPAYTSPADRDGYDTGVRNVWADPMRFPDDFVRDNLGGPVDAHIFARLGEVIGPDRVFVYRGFFSETLARLPATKAALVHIDCDLYSSTREVFDALAGRDMFQDGCVILFDDYNCFRANPAFGERRAFAEFLAGQSRYTASPFYTYGANGAAFLLHDTTVGAGL